MKNPVLASIALHLAAFIILLADIPFWYTAPKKDRFVPPPIIVDISKVEIAPKTNLPVKKEIVKKDPPKKVVEEVKPKPNPPEPKMSKVEVVKKPQMTPIPPAPVVTQKPKQVQNKQGVTAVKEKQPETKPKQVVKKTQKVTPSRQVKTKQTQEDEEMKSLLASLEKLEKEEQAIKAEKKQLKAAVQEDEVTQGIKGGTMGDYRRELTISEQDALSSRLSACWNIDAGVKGAVNMVVEIRVNLRKDGSVEEVRIADRARYNTDTSFRSVAESARRAVFICEYNKEESPFKFLAVKYPQNFDVWKTLVLFFNPLDGGVK